MNMHRRDQFPFLEPAAIDCLYMFLLGRLPTHEQSMWMRNNCNDPWLTNGVMAFQWPWRSAKPILLVYACCHGAQLCKHWFEHSFSGHIFSNYNVVFVQNYRAMGDAHYMPGQAKAVDMLPDTYRDLFKAVFARADVIIHHPAYGGTEFSPDYLLNKFARKDAREFSFHSPSNGALWPVCLYGDAWAKDLLRKKTFTARRLADAINWKVLDCRMRERFDEAYARMLRKDKKVTVGLSDFFLRHWQSTRMFITFNHPSFPLASYMAARLERLVEYKSDTLTEKEEASILAGPWNACNFQPVWPDHDRTGIELGARYVYLFNQGQEQFVQDEVNRCALEVAAEKITSNHK